MVEEAAPEQRRSRYRGKIPVTAGPRCDQTAEKKVSPRLVMAVYSASQGSAALRWLEQNMPVILT